MANRLESLIEDWCNGSLSAEDSKELSSLLRSSAEARSTFKEAADLHGLLHAAADSLAIEFASGHGAITVAPKSSFALLQVGWTSTLGAILGMALGVIGVSTVWALASPSIVAVSATVSTLHDASFEEVTREIPRGFPTEFGQWCGDEVEIVKQDRHRGAANGQALRFVTAMPDNATPSARAIACDLFQLVDLTNLQHTRHESSDVVLELSAHFMDTRARNSKPSVTFFCQIYLFRGEIVNVSDHWPEAISEAIGSGSVGVTTLGESNWKKITARCLVPTDVDFAVVHLAARPNQRVPIPDGLFVDEIELVARTQPVLPVRDGHKR